MRRYPRPVPHYRSGASEQDYLALKEAMLELAREGEFDMNDALVYALARGVTSNAGDVAAILGDLVDLGDLRDCGRSGDGGASRFGLPST